MTSATTSRLPTTLLGQLRRHARRYAFGIGLLALYQTGQYAFDRSLLQAVDAMLEGRTSEGAQLGWMLIGLAGALLGVRVWSRVSMFNAGRLAEYELRNALLHKLQQLGPTFYGKMSSGEIMSRSTNDLGQVRLLFGFGVLNAINTAFALTSALAVTFAISVELSLAALATLPLLFIAMAGFARSMFARQRENQEALGAMSSEVQAGIAGVRVVRSFGLEAHELQRFAATNQDYLMKSLRAARVRGVMFPVVGAISALGTVIVLWYGGHLVLHEQITAGGFLAFFRALSRLTWPLMSLGFLASLIQRGRASFARVAEVFLVEPEITDGPLPAPAQVQGRLRVSHLSYAYGDHRVLEDVSFDVEPGQLVAIVGRTGSGKSTLAALLPRLQRTPERSVYLDDQDVCALPLRTVRGAIGYAQQGAFLFSTTVGRNIAFCLDDPDGPEGSAAVRGAAREAQIEDEVAHLPDGYDTVVGERGVQLSGGQKQRVALARALLAGPRVLVLDDPLSAVDARTERAILDAIEAQRSRRSVVLITHRVAAASRCDKIVVLERGRVVDQGTHAELCARGGLYAQFVEEQRIEGELQALAGEELEPAEARA